MLIKGSDLNHRQRNQVLSAFIYRWTKDNPRRCQVWRCDKCDIRNPYVNSKSAEEHSHPTVPLQTDEEWLRDHAFYFTRDGRRLMPNESYAEPVYVAEDLHQTQIEADGPSR